MTEKQTPIEIPILSDVPVAEESAGIQESVQNLDDSSPASKGGKARMKRLSRAERSALAGNAARARWEKKDTEVKEQESETNSGPVHCPACAASQSLEAGEGTHIMPSIEHPIPATKSLAPTPALRPNPMLKEFGSALAAAERRLAKAIEERAKAANIWAVLQSEIPYLERTIAVLRGQPVPNLPASTPEFASVFPLSDPAQARPRHPEVSRAQGGAFSGVDLTEDDEDRFLRESGLPGGEWR